MDDNDIREAIIAEEIRLGYRPDRYREWTKDEEWEHRFGAFWLGVALFVIPLLLVWVFGS